jgi:hypothetical protein
MCEWFAFRLFVAIFAFKRVFLFVIKSRFWVYFRVLPPLKRMSAIAKESVEIQNYLNAHLNPVREI